MAAVFHTSRIVEFADTDMAGIVHFSNFFRYMEAAEHAFLRARGLSFRVHHDGVEYGLPRVAASCDYRAPARFADVLTVGVSIARLGRSSVTYAFDFRRDGEDIAQGQVTSVFCRFEDGRPKACDMPAAFRAKLEGDGDRPAPEIAASAE